MCHLLHVIYVKYNIRLAMKQSMYHICVLYVSNVCVHYKFHPFFTIQRNMKNRCNFIPYTDFMQNFIYSFLRKLS